MSKLKILHIHDGDLDDPRIINSANTGKKNNFDVYFCGENQGKTFSSDVFTEKHWIKIPKWVRISKESSFLERFWNFYPYPKHFASLQKQLKKVIEKVRPDIIHAHNIFCGYPISSFGIPMVLDDHEFYSVHIKAQNEIRKDIKTKIITKIKENRWGEWERSIGEKYPIISVSKSIVEHHKQYCKNAFLVPNYPLKNEIIFDKLNNAQKNKLNSVYLGRDLIDTPNAVRNIGGLHEFFNKKNNVGKLLRIGVASPNTTNISSCGLVKMDEAYKIMQTKGHIGLVPWKKHWFHKYGNPNKVYEYAHCGLWVMVIDDLKSVLEDFGDNCDKFSNYEELEALLKKYNNDPEMLDKKRLNMLKHAHENLIWEKVEQNIIDAYKVA